MIDNLQFLAAYRALDQLAKDFPAYASDIQPLRHDIGRVIYSLSPPSSSRVRKPVLVSSLPAFDQMQYYQLENEWAALRADPMGELLKATDLFVRVKQFNLQHLDFTGGWLLQARMALALDRSVEGGYAGQQLYALGLSRSINSEVINLFVALEERRWLTPPPPASTAATSTQK